MSTPNDINSFVHEVTANEAFHNVVTNPITPIAAFVLVSATLCVGIAMCSNIKKSDADCLRERQARRLHTPRYL